ADNCWITPTAQHLDGALIGGETASLTILLRLAKNPFADANFVYVPYCTGDVHIGSATVDMDVNGTKKTTYFWGAKNLDMYLARLVPTFPQTTRVILTGISAGGYGAYLNVDRVRSAFGVRVDVIDDSGPPFDAPPDVASVADGGGPKYAPWGVIYP